MRITQPRPTDIVDVEIAAGANIAASKVIQTFAVHTDTKLVRKTASETVNNSNVLQNDDELFFAMAANEVWHVRLFLIYQSTAVADIKVCPSLPALASSQGYSVQRSATPTFQLVLDLPVGSVVSFEGTGAAIVHCQAIEWKVSNGANAGNFQIQWAQNTAEVSNTVVASNSFLLAFKLA